MDSKEERNFLPIEDVLESILLPSNKPILKKCLFWTRKNLKATLPLGALAQIDGSRSRLIVLESGVVD